MACGGSTSSSDAGAGGSGGATSGHDGGQIGAVCTLTSECAAPLVCTGQRCRAQCNDARDCPPGQDCVLVGGVVAACQLKDETHCAYNSDCPAAQLCAADGQCRNPCATDRDCAAGQSCGGGVCQ